MFGSDVVADATLTIFHPNGIAVEARRAQVASGAECVVQAVNAFAGHRVARAWNRRVDVAGALARLAHFAFDFGSAEESVCATLALVARVTRLAIATKNFKP